MLRERDVELIFLRVECTDINWFGPPAVCFGNNFPEVIIPGVIIRISWAVGNKIQFTRWRECGVSIGIHRGGKRYFRRYCPGITVFSGYKDPRAFADRPGEI